LARQLALCLTPLGACGLFLGLSATTVKLLREEGLQLLWAQPTRAALLVAAMLWSLQLAWQISRPFNAPARALLLLSCSLAVSLIGYGWWLQFWCWNYPPPDCVHAVRGWRARHRPKRLRTD
jgi:hypothetical protein